MKATEWKKALASGALATLDLYSDPEAAAARYVSAIDRFEEKYGEGRDLLLFSVPGRTEVQGNHTDHQHGRVLAAAIDRDLIAVVAKSEEATVRITSEGYPEDVVPLALSKCPEEVPNYSSLALIAGTLGGFEQRGFSVGGFDAYTQSLVLKGSGISSSAAFEVMVGNILNHLFNGGSVSNEEIAKIAQFAENAYFGKPCGLMDQMACAVGGFVYIDFKDPTAPVIRPIDFSLSERGYVLCIVNTGGNHADLNEDYASVPAEMRKVASYFGKPVLRDVTAAQIVENLPILRRVVGDRACLRALHFVEENERVEKTARKLAEGDISAFLDSVIASGNSSFRYLQNVYTVKNVEEQGLSVALALSEMALSGKDCAWRVHGGGFAGTVQAFVKEEEAEGYRALMDSVFGEGACMMLRVRKEGAIAVTL